MHCTAATHMVAADKSGSDCFLAWYYILAQIPNIPLLFMSNIVWQYPLLTRTQAFKRKCKGVSVPSLPSSSNFTEIMLFMQLSSFSQSSGFSNHLQDLNYNIQSHVYREGRKQKNKFTLILIS